MTNANPRAESSSRKGAGHTRYCAATPGANTRNTSHTAPTVAKTSCFRRTHARPSVLTTTIPFSTFATSTCAAVRLINETREKSGSPVSRSTLVNPQMPQNPPYPSTFVKNSFGHTMSGNDHPTSVATIALPANTAAPRGLCASAHRPKTGTTNNGDTFKLQASASASPARSHRFSDSASTVKNNAATSIESIFPWNPDTMIDTGLTANSASAHVGICTPFLTTRSSPSTTVTSARIPPSRNQNANADTSPPDNLSTPTM